MGVNKSLPEAIRKIIKKLHNASGEVNIDWRYFQYMHKHVTVQYSTVYTVLCTCTVHLTVVLCQLENTSTCPNTYKYILVHYVFYYEDTLAYISRISL